MKRANRLVQIQKLERELESSRVDAITAGRQPIALIMRYPVLSMSISAVVLGLLARGAIARPLPAVVKVLTIPLFRKFALQAFATYQNSQR